LALAFMVSQIVSSVGPPVAIIGNLASISQSSLMILTTTGISSASDRL